MKTELCNFSGFKIYPGHGKRHIKIDGKSFTFINGKSEQAHLCKRNPRKIDWTVLYRRKHKKGNAETVVKKKGKRTSKRQRAYVGASMTDIIAKRSLEFRKTQRDNAIKAAKKTQAEKPKAAAKGKTAAKPVQKAQKAAKTAPAAKPRVGGKR